MRKILRSTKSLNKVSIAFLVLFVLLILSRGYFPDTNDDGWSDPPIIDYLLVTGFGICVAIIGTLYTYNSWRLDTKQFWQWLLQSSSIRPPKQWRYNTREPLGHWFLRLISPIFILGGITMIIVMLANIIDFFFG